MLTPESLRELVKYDPDTGVFIRTVDQGRWKAGEIAGGPQNRGYLRIAVAGERHLAHRLAWLYMTGQWPQENVDHRNGVRTDNRWTNLRAATPKQNQMNRGADSGSASGYKNVYRAKKGWRVRIEEREVWGFETPEDANEFACLMREMLHGEFACHAR